jgi:hypothetical protein
VTAGTLREACDELRQWLDATEPLIAEPDTDGTRCHTKPGSRPPWNGAVAYAILDAAEVVRRLEASLRRDVTGRLGPRRGGSYGNTHAAIIAIAQLGHGVPEDRQRQAMVVVARLVLPLQQLPANDQAERFVTLQARCPYCGLGKLRWAEQSGRVTCLRYGACFDGTGKHPMGHMGINLVTNEGAVYWQDGAVTP